MAFGLIFVEAGNTWNNLESTDPFNLRRSVGIGARIFMPMLGMLGFDYAYGFIGIIEDPQTSHTLFQKTGLFFLIAGLFFFSMGYFKIKNRRDRMINNYIYLFINLTALIVLFYGLL